MLDSCWVVCSFLVNLPSFCLSPSLPVAWLRIIGCLFTSCILVNVILQDIYFGVHFGALKAAIFYQILILVILWLNREKLIRGMKVLMESNKIEQPKMKLFIKLLIAFGVFLIFRTFEYYLTIN